MTNQKTRAKAALALTFVGDSLSMPVHWYYRQSDILRQFPPSGIRGLQPAPALHPSSIMSLHSTGRGGRGSHSDGEAVIGNIILKDKAKYWNKTNMHYHYGMPAGENTLNAWCARWMIKWVTDQPEDIPQLNDWLKYYVNKMTAEPAAHPDTYAESYHREFFANFNHGKPLSECGGYTHDTPSMGALVTVAPLALVLLNTLSLADTQALCRKFVYATHPDNLLLKVVDRYVYLLDQLINQHTDDIKALFVESASVVPKGKIQKFSNLIDSVDISLPIPALVSEDTAVVGRTYSPACYITDSWPGVCYLAARYWQSPATGLLVNTNLGGENAHRGSVLGCLLGLASAHQTEFYSGLYRFAEIDAEIENWCNRYFTCD